MDEFGFNLHNRKLLRFGFILFENDYWCLIAVEFLFYFLTTKTYEKMNIFKLIFIM
jgi:hypothetical protein